MEALLEPAAEPTCSLRAMYELQMCKELILPQVHSCRIANGAQLVRVWGWQAHAYCRTLK